MPQRPFPHRTLVWAAVLAVVPACGGVRAQDTGLRGGIDSGGFPTSPSAAPLSTPEDVTPPTPANEGAGSADGTAPSQSDQNDTDRNAPNYGKPRKMKAKLYRPNPKTSPPLAPLVPYRGAPGLQHKALNPVAAPKDATDPEQPAPTVAVIPSPERPKRVPAELDPYAPTGIQVGELRLLPFVEASTGYESNPNQVSTGVKPSVVLRGDAGLDVASDFSNHSLTASLRGGYSDFPSNANANRPDLSGTVRGRIDVTRLDTIDLETRFTLATQTPGSPLLAVPNSTFIVNRPLITSEGATIGGNHTFNRLTIGLKGTIDRTQYGDGTLSDGTTYRYSQDNYDDYGVVLKASYEVTPEVIPFTEMGYDARVRDNPIDLSGYLRDSIGGFGRAGSTFEIFHLLTGTISAGYLERHYSDPRLPNLRGPTVDGDLTYKVTPLTSVTFRASTTASETTLAGASGAISRSFSIEVAHTFFRNFTVTGIATYQPNDYQGVVVNEAYTQFTLKGAYSVTRDIQLVGSASRQALNSSILGSSFVDNIFLLGVRLQR